MKEMHVKTKYLFDSLEKIDQLFETKQVSVGEYIQIGLLMNILEYLMKKDPLQ